MSELRTAAGKALPEAFDRWMTTAGLPDFRDTLIAAILDIEDEASQPGLREARAMVAFTLATGRYPDDHPIVAARRTLLEWFDDRLTHPTSSPEPSDTGELARLRAIEAAARAAWENDVIEPGEHRAALRAALAHPTSSPEPLYIIFDGPPSHESGRFVEVETATGRSVGMDGREWRERPDGLWSLGPFFGLGLSA